MTGSASTRWTLHTECRRQKTLDKSIFKRRSLIFISENVGGVWGGGRVADCGLHRGWRIYVRGVLGPKTPPGRTQDAPRCPQTRPRRPRTPPIGPKTLPKRPETRPRRPPNAPGVEKLSQNEAKMVPKSIRIRSHLGNFKISKIDLWLQWGLDF